jgi:hypothetical protein
MTCRWVCIALAVCSAAEAAEKGRVRIAPLPVKALTGDDRLDRELPKRFEVRLLGTNQVECPLPEKVEAFLQTRAGAPCEKDVACLKTLAENTSSLYALAASIRLNGAATAFVVSATLFRVDGQKKDVAFEYKINRDAMTLPAAGDEAIKELVMRLELEKLERVLPMQAHEETPGVSEPVDEGATGRRAGLAVIGVGALSAIIGGVMLAVGSSQMGNITVVNGNVPLSQLPAESHASTLQNAGGAMLGIGLAVVAAGGVIWLMSPNAPVQVSAAPMPSGAAVMLRGTW